MYSVLYKPKSKATNRRIKKIGMFVVNTQDHADNWFELV